ncbi:hypothetical protein A0J61_05384 [Choanephora cucurbitarum]|uniref:Uncharacterized protein n=1 Tax=Choanephora cucurbitarum TaxID=101091 RepID=A0A1C7NC31_9FUNG|nr:hypothetical protein A0J61_05384 [Choanephora cucurbitarum]
MSCFRDHTFVVCNGKYLDFSASPYASNFLASPDANDIPFLFTDRHVHFLKSGFYDVRGLQTKTKTEYPLRTLLMEAISDSVNQFIQPKNTLHMACYESALTNYITNLSVIWGDNKMINILLDKLLLVLLRIHLAPTRERKHQEFIKSMKNASKERKDKAAKGSKTEADHPTNWFPLLHQSRRRLIVRGYEAKMGSSSPKKNPRLLLPRGNNLLSLMSPKVLSVQKKIPAIQHPSIASAEAGPSMLQTGRMEIDIPTQPYEGKGKAPMNPQSDPKPATFQPLMTGETHTIPPAVPEDYASMDENDVVEEEDALKDADDDAPRNRLNGLKGFIKSLLLRGEDLPNEEDLEDLRSDLNEKETEKIPAIQHPSTASAEAGPSMLHTSRMEIDIPTRPYEGKGKVPMNPQSDPNSVTFQPPMTGEIHTIPLAVPEDYASMDENGVVEEEDALKDVDDGAPRNRLNGLKGFIKSLLLRDEDLHNEQDLTGLRSDLNEKETKLKILHPFKEELLSYWLQATFCKILANDLLRCAGYAKFCRKICPMPTATQSSF